MKLIRLKQFTIGVIFYLIAVILWGAYVRATGSGAGCGSHWPLCNGVAIPRAASVQTQIEYLHRTTSGLSLVLVLALSAALFKAFPKGAFVRKLAATAAISILMEALIGAGLVLLELVSHDQSIKRTISIALHFVNTLVLLGAITSILPCLNLGGGGWKWKTPKLKQEAILLTLCFCLVGMAGAITALGDTLFPAQSLAEGFRQDWSESSHFLVRLRFIHPTLAVLFGLGSTAWIASRGMSRSLIFLIFSNLGLGLTNILLLAPIWLQMTHLAVALGVWIAWVMWVNRHCNGEL